MKIFIIVFYIAALNAVWLPGVLAAPCNQGGFCQTLQPRAQNNQKPNFGLAAIIDYNKNPENIFVTLYEWGLRFVGIAALTMIVLGGVEYILFAANPSKLGEAKNRIWNAIFGLVLALISYLILYTINPDLVKFNIRLF